MGFLSLPNEILLSIAELGHDWDIASLVQVNHHLYALLTCSLYRRCARDYFNPILTWAANRGNEYTAQKCLKESADLVDESELYRAIAISAEYGHEGVVRVFLENGISPNRYHRECHDPLSFAVARGHVSTASTLLAHGAESWNNDAAVLCDAIKSKEPLAMVKLLVEKGQFDPKCIDCSRPALLEAAMLGQAEVVRYLLQKGCDVETPDYPDGETSICLAAAEGNLETVHVLLEYGANVNPVLWNGTTMRPLHSAMERYHIEVAISLLVNMDLTTLPKDPNEQGLLLCVAAASGLDVLAELLLMHGCDPEAVLLDDDDISPEYEEGMSASVWAAAFGHVKVLELLLNYRADPDWPLLMAIKRGHLHVVKVLLENGASCSMEVLPSAIRHEAIFRLLLEHGADPKAEEEDEFLLITAIKSGQEAVVKILLDLGLTMSNLRYPTYTGATGGTDMLEFLLQHEILPPPSEDSEGDRAVHYAVFNWDVSLLKLLHNRRCPIRRYGHHDYLQEALNMPSPEIFESMLDVLLSYGVDINTKGCQEQNCLWDAIHRHEAFRLKILLEKGADPLFQSRNNETPLMFAALVNFAEGVKILLQAIGSRVSPQVASQVNAGLRVARSQGSGKAVRVLERVYYCELPSKT